MRRHQINSFSMDNSNLSGGFSHSADNTFSKSGHISAKAGRVELTEHQPLLAAQGPFGTCLLFIRTARRSQRCEPTMFLYTYHHHININFLQTQLVLLVSWLSSRTWIEQVEFDANSSLNFSLNLKRVLIPKMRAALIVIALQVSRRITSTSKIKADVLRLVVSLWASWRCIGLPVLVLRRAIG
jgi:hypothetical protein